MCIHIYVYIYIYIYKQCVYIYVYIYIHIYIYIYMTCYIAEVPEIGGFGRSPASSCTLRVSLNFRIRLTLKLAANCRTLKFG